jgi:hypothetical protein
VRLSNTVFIATEVHLEENVMKRTPAFNMQGSISTFTAAALATIISLGILSAVVAMLQSRGKPLELLVAAERACTQHTYVSERQTCMNEWLAASRPETVAHR